MKNLVFRLALLLTIGFFVPAANGYCQDSTTTEDIQFTPIEDSAASVVPKQAAGLDTAKAVATNKPQTNTAPPVLQGAPKPANQTLWAIFIAGFLGGFAALIMPCIFPLLPMTVSYFTKGADKGKGVRKALTYGLSIIVIYVLLGLLVSVIFGADALNSLSTNGIFNFFLFALLIIFAASFLGAFEITLPSSWVNKMDEKSSGSGLTGIFFMAATLAVVSFSCTGPIIGLLLAQAATTGALLGPAVGMFGFSLALAIPFTLFALFPGWMKSLPKSGGWLNSVKVVLGFLELAFAFKFLSNVDLAYHWHWFDREVFLVLWIIIFGLMGLYLLGKLRLSHDSEQAPPLSVIRLFLAIITLAFSMYMIPGLWGAPLKAISAFMPPRTTLDFDLSTGVSSAVAAPSNTPHKYITLFDKPKGFNPYFDYNEGLAYARQTGKPILIDFTGHACTNCRKMEEDVWPDPQVRQRINNDYVLIQLYVDDKTDLAPNEQTTTPQGRSIKTIANKWSYLQTSRFGANSQPFYVLLNPQTEQPLVPPQGADYEPANYLKFLDAGLSSYKVAGK